MRGENRGCFAASIPMIANASEVRMYIDESIRRIENGELASEEGSWLQGVFGKAAKKYEQWARDTLLEVLRACEIDYQRTPRPGGPTLPKFDKLTLGQIAYYFSEISKDIQPAIQGGILSRRINYGAFCSTMSEVNGVWTDCIKHGHATLDAQLAVKSLRTMKATIDHTVTKK
jgi:hypothetical protein